MPPSVSRHVTIKKTDEERRLVFGEVYAPNVLDSHGAMMLADDVEAMAHRFMQIPVLKSAIDTDHNHVSAQAYPVESFIARGHPDYNEGAWVLAVKVDDENVWDRIKKGDINGFSVDAFAKVAEVEVEVTLMKSAFSITEESAGHTHFLFAEYDDNGKVVSGVTSPGPDGHVHILKRASVTETAGDGDAAHVHRFHLS